MSSIQIRSGAGPELLADWKHLLRHRRDPLKPIVVIVPSPTVADWLRTRMPLVNVKIVTWTDWLWDLMPSHFRRWPVDAEHILESILPRDITVHLDSTLPGLYLTVIRAAIECRIQNISPDNLDDNDPVLAMTLQWLNHQVFTGDLYDTVRLYEYAKDHWNVLGSSLSGIIFWGFVDFSPMQWQLIETMGQHHPCVVYGVDASEQRHWPSGVSLRLLANPGHGPTTETVSVPEGYLGPEAITRLIAEQLRGGASIQDIMVIADEGSLRRIVIALSHVGIASRTGQLVPYEVSATWRALCLGKTARRSWRRLEDRYPSLVAWLSAWNATWETMTEWGQARHLVDEAATKIPALAPLSTDLKRWETLATVCPSPGRELLQQEMLTLAQYLRGTPATDPIDAVWVVRPTDASGMVADEVIVAPEAFGELSQPTGMVPWLQKLQAGHARRLRTKISEAAARCSFLLGTTGARSFQSLVSIQEPEANPESLAWYAEWYGTGAFHAQPGLPAAPISVTDLEKFGTCPRAYFLSRGLRLKPWDDDPLREFPALYGQWAHLALFYLNQDPTISVSQAVSAAMGAIKAHEDLLEPIVRQARHRLEANLQYVWSSIQGAREAPQVVLSEVEWIWDYEIALNRWPIRMRLDRLEHYAAHDVVVDFKTGQIANPEKVLPDQLQIPVYLSAWRDRFPDRASVRGVLWGITEKNHFRAREVLGDEKLDRTTREVVDGILSRIQQGAFFPAPQAKSDPCRVCDYRLLCPANVRHIAQIKLREHREFLALWTEGNLGVDDEA